MGFINQFITRGAPPCMMKCIHGVGTAPLRGEDLRVNSGSVPGISGCYTTFWCHLFGFFSGFVPASKTRIPGGAFFGPPPFWRSRGNPHLIVRHQISHLPTRWPLAQSPHKSTTKHVTSGNHTKNYCKLPFIVDLPIKNGDYP